MVENPESPKALPEPEKKKNCINISIDLDELYKNIPNIPIPENEATWKSIEEMSPEYKQQSSLLQILMFFIARSCNEGAEVKDNTTKRSILIRHLLGLFIDNLNINGYTKYGILSEMLQDTYMSISGEKYIEKMLEEIKTQKDRLSEEKSKLYTS